jgi:putative protease
MVASINLSGKTELLMPAGNLHKLKTAVLYGADAVYLGTPDMSLRTKSEFSLEDVLEGVRFAHEHGVRVYLTLNLFSHNKDIPKLEHYIDTVRIVKPDGLIIADPGVFQYVKQRAPELELHISTQANICSWLSVQFWQDMGAKLVVLAREVSFDEMREIREHCPDIKLESFVHGSMCMTYSGRCLLSNFMVERGANQGSCANSCRWKYNLHIKLKDGTVQDLEINEDNMDLFEFLLEEEHRPGELMAIEEDIRGAYILNSRDLCLMPKLNEYLSIGVDSLKVEGRGKSPYYVAIAARSYRQAIDDWYANPQDWKPDAYMDELDTIQNRGYTLAFHEGRLSNLGHNYDDGYYAGGWEFAGFIVDITEDAFIIEVKNRLVSGDVLEFLPPREKDGIYLRAYDYEIAKTGDRKSEVHAGPRLAIRIPFSAFDHEDATTLAARMPIHTVLRKERTLTPEQWNRIKLDAKVQQVEAKGLPVEHYFDKRDEYKAQRSEQEEAAPKCSARSPRIGTEGCCARGCNGCLMFWNDPQYAKARDLLAKKKDGMLLNKQEARDAMEQK